MTLTNKNPHVFKLQIVKDGKVIAEHPFSYDSSLDFDMDLERIGIQDGRIIYREIGS